MAGIFMRRIDPNVTVHPSICPLDCADTCSLAIDVKNGVIDAVRGSSANPFTGSKICSKVAKGLPLQVHGPGRLRTPMRRCGVKGDGVYEAISWDQALDTIYERYQTIIERHGP
jgi:anaerobic selenocysteine-containing dehydrogenase